MSSLVIVLTCNSVLTCNYVQGETPLHAACRHGLVNLVRSLLEAGSNANIQTSLSADEDRGITKQTPLHVAVEAGHKDIVKVFLDFKGIMRLVYFLLALHASVLVLFVMCYEHHHSPSLNKYQCSNLQKFL